MARPDVTGIANEGRALGAPAPRTGGTAAATSGGSQAAVEPRR